MPLHEMPSITSAPQAMDARCRSPRSSDAGLPTTRIRAWTRVDDPSVHRGDLKAFPRLRIEVNSRDGSTTGQGSDIPVSDSGQHLQGPYGVRAAQVGKSSSRKGRSARRRTWWASIRSPMAGTLIASVLLLRVPASLTVGAAVVILIISAGETIVISAVVFGRTGDGRLRPERQNDGARGDGDRELQRLLLLVLLGHRASAHEAGADRRNHGSSCRNFTRDAKPRPTAPCPARSPCPCTGSSASPPRRRRLLMRDDRHGRRGSRASRSCSPCRPNIAGRRSGLRVPIVRP